MRFPSLQSLAGEAWRSFRRFPIAIVLAVKGVVIGMRWTHLIEHLSFQETPGWYWDAILSCYLGMLLSVAATVWVEKRRGAREITGRSGGKWWRNWAITAQVGVLGLTALYYWSLPSRMTEIAGIRTLVLALGLHWLIAVIGFGSGELNGFWQFNKRLFLRALIAYLYTMVLYIGISLALLAVERLFSVNVRSEVYEDCSWILGGIFSVWFFLAGFPKTYDSPDVITDYPKGLKIFTQYVLLVLVTVYLLILYAYMFKIIFTWHWPVGWVAWLVMAFAVAGILSLLLIYPLRTDANNAWVRSYSKFFYLALLPLIVLLFVAIFKRVVPYGITEQRYFLLLLALWLLGITIYFLASQRKDIRVLPMSLCIAAFLSCWGPWGAFSVSLRSQEHRLMRLLEKDGLMTGGKLTANKGASVGLKDRKAISSITDYIVGQHGYEALQPFFREDLDSMMRHNRLTDRWQSGDQSQAIVRLMNIQYATQWEDAVDVFNSHMTFYCTQKLSDSAVLIAGAQYLGNFRVGPTDTDWDFVSVGDGKLRIVPDTGRNLLRLAWVSGGEEVLVDLRPVTRGIMASGATYSILLPSEQMELAFSGSSIAGKVVLTELQGIERDSTVRFNEIKGMILFSKK